MAVLMCVLWNPNIVSKIVDEHVDMRANLVGTYNESGDLVEFSGSSRGVGV